MAMSRKHYRAVAAAIKSALDGIRMELDGEIIEGMWEPREAYEALEAVARDLADIFKADNSDFSYQTFYEACGINPVAHAGRR